MNTWCEYSKLHPTEFEFFVHCSSFSLIDPPRGFGFKFSLIINVMNDAVIAQVFESLRIPQAAETHKLIKNATGQTDASFPERMVSRRDWEGT